MTRRLIVRPRARHDLDEIWAYTEARWGTSQADEYVRSLLAGIDDLVDQPERGSDRSYIRKGLRKITVGSHAIYYFHDARELRISRVLHVRRDADREL